MRPGVRNGADLLTCDGRSANPVRSAAGQLLTFRTVWAVMQINGFTVPLVNVYAPVEPAPRKDFWEEIVGSLPSRKFVFLGDWNVIEDPFDSSTRSNWLTRQETVPFLNLKARFNISDIRSDSSAHKGPRFTRFQTRDGKFIWSTLDRFYAPVSFFWGLTITTVHHADFTLSDHLPASLLLHGVVKPIVTTNTSVSFKVDSMILKDPQIKSKIGEVWRKHRAAADLGIQAIF
ncbi:hypothetical protein R1sor_001771 [Riccia sorocarpa]|uniref:Endonuclease/exonuclease/phosphatase domain-containing protein n=1 Tax=Riccia sorocarpa TaxID=122646 RepID=A0ABD3H2T4_9MARC